MQSRSLLIAWTLLLMGPTIGQPADPSVSLELATEPGFPIDGNQRWLRFLKDRTFGFTDVRMRSARAGDVPSIENRGTDSAPRYTVVGMLTARGRLALPGLELRYGQRQELSDWLQKLRRGGDDAVTAPVGAFGLTSKQLVTLHDALKKRVAMSTQGKSARDLLQHIRQITNVPIDLDASAQQVLSGDKPVLDELDGLSCGTALAAAVRPYGLLVTPTGQETRTVGLRVTGTAKLEDAWPVGIRSKSNPQDLAPTLLKFISVEIVDQPLDDTLDVIQQRLEIPFLYDHNALARHEVDLHAPVRLPATKTFYKKIIDNLLFQKLLVSELRTDEAGKPFLWITSAKR